jgi:hypothetical protein
MKREEAELILKKFQEGSKFIIKFQHDWSDDVVLPGTADVTYIMKDEKDEIKFFVVNDAAFCHCYCKYVSEHAAEYEQLHLVEEFAFCFSGEEEDDYPNICHYSGIKDNINLENIDIKNVFEIKRIDGIDYDD